MEKARNSKPSSKSGNLQVFTDAGNPYVLHLKSMEGKLSVIKIVWYVLILSEKNIRRGK
ncbi:hypothetical protein [Cylindrospermopsis raciborskii]|uniref:hypothetical protein n=1 Tax=Cylindrospermopsis raciborskii TaxID=77022 RepID=UPI0015C4D345|nr:hypothetical protein [Cylindrospermopsis raciborskii]